VHKIAHNKKVLTNTNINNNNINNQPQTYYKNIITAPNCFTILHEGTTLNDNLRKHAAAPKIPNYPHPHPRYSELPRIKLKMLDPQLRQLEQQLNPVDEYGQQANPEWFNDLTLDMIDCTCPHKIKFEQLFDKEQQDQEAMVWTACKHTTIAAAKRQMKAAPTPDPDVADDFVKHSMQIIEHEIGPQLHHFGYSVKDWMEHLDSTKQKALQPVLDYYKGNTLNISPKDLHNIKHGHYTGILKEELQPPDGKPRMVCSVPQRTKYIMGPVTWALEEIAQDGLRGYCGGMNLTQMAEKINHYLALGFTQVYEGDGSAFDNTQDVSLKQLDRNIYKIVSDKVYHVPKQHFDKVTQALYKTMDIEYIDGNKKRPLLRYKILGTVFSGDCDTTLMNTIRMAMYNRYVNDKAGLVFGRDYICFSKGDDFTLMYKPYVTKEFINQAYYRYFLKAVPDPKDHKASTYGLGQVLKFLEGGDASIIKFCSLRAWFTDISETKIYLTRDIKKFMTLSKYSRKTKNYTVIQKIIYLHDIAYSLRRTYKGIRFFENIANHYDQLAERYMQDTTIPIKLINMVKQRDARHYQEKCKTNDVAYNPDYFAKLESDNKENVKHRHNQVRIIGDYWEAMQRYEKIHTDELDERTAEYISKLIENEISVSVIKSMYDTGPRKYY